MDNFGHLLSLLFFHCLFLLRREEVAFCDDLAILPRLVEASSLVLLAVYRAFDDIVRANRLKSCRWDNLADRHLNLAVYIFDRGAHMHGSARRRRLGYTQAS